MMCNTPISIIKYVKKFFVVITVMGLSLTAYASDVSIGGVAENLLAPTELLTKLALLACYIVGAAMLMMAIAQYKMHRQNPKLVPLTTPISLVILGIIALLIPYGSNMFGESASAANQNKGSAHKQNVLPLPDINQKGPMLPLPSNPSDQGDGQSHPDSNTGESTGTTNGSPADSGSGTSGGGHWSSDPRYNR